MKKQKRKVKTKLVRIDHRTEIEVPVAISDRAARERYLERQERWAKAEKDKTRGMRGRNNGLIG